MSRLALSLVESQLVRLAILRRNDAERAVRAQFEADIAVVRRAHGIGDDVQGVQIAETAEGLVFDVPGSQAVYDATVGIEIPPAAAYCVEGE